MASSGKKKTTMAKLSRESRLRERRVEKKARKEARKLAASQPDQPDDELSEFDQDERSGDLDAGAQTDDGRDGSTREPVAGTDRVLASPPAAGAGE